MIANLLWPPNASKLVTVFAARWREAPSEIHGVTLDLAVGPG
jgi:hypothetical protein